VAFSPRAFEQRPPSGEVLVWDVSGFSDENLGRAIRLWNDRLARDPTLWESGLKLVRIREILRNALLEYDESTLTVITSYLDRGANPE
jgi:hypothetical protein